MAVSASGEFYISPTNLNFDYVTLKTPEHTDGITVNKNDMTQTEYGLQINGAGYTTSYPAYFTLEFYKNNTKFYTSNTSDWSTAGSSVLGYQHIFTAGSDYYNAYSSYLGSGSGSSGTSSGTNTISGGSSGQGSTNSGTGIIPSSNNGTDTYTWTDNPTVSGVSICDTDILNDCLMHLKYDEGGKKHALKSYLDDGTLLTDSEGLADVKYYAHSTFDADKFTVVGSPTITADGIISDFSTSNYLTVSLNNSYNTLEIKSKIKVLNDLSNSCYYNFSNSDNRKYFDLCIINTKLRFRVVSNATLAYSFDVNTNTEYYTRFTFDGTTYKCAISTDGVTWNEQTIGDLSAIDIVYNCYIGNVFNQTLPCLGAIDLKYFDVKFNNVPIFSGNLTDVDNIKSDFSGSATVSATGIASGFSASDYLTFDTSNIDWTKPFDLYVSCKTGTVAAVLNSCLTSYGMPLLGDHSDGVNHYWRLCPNGIPESFALGGVSQALPITAVASNTDYWHHVNYDGTKFTWEISTNGSSYTTVGTLAGTATISATTAWLGNQQGSTSRYWTGSINFNDLKVYQYNNIICQPCLRIPYTASKTGSKIVDSYYRDRVGDMYNQFGYAPYYTLSDSDFTLPMGEVYGLIGEVDKNALSKDGSNAEFPYIIESSLDTTTGSGYRIYSNGIYEEWGANNKTNNTSWIVNLTKKYKSSTSYRVFLTFYKESGQANYYEAFVNYQIKSTFTVYQGSTAIETLYWHTIGIIE